MRHPTESRSRDQVLGMGGGSHAASVLQAHLLLKGYRKNIIFFMWDLVSTLARTGPLWRVLVWRATPELHEITRRKATSKF